MRVMIVEDEMLVAMLLEDMLTDLGHAVVKIVARMEEAMISAKNADIDFAVLDLNLNGQQTYPVAELLRARNVPFLFATGYGQGALQARFKGVPTLQKPFVGDQLRKAVDAISRASKSDRLGTGELVEPGGVEPPTS